MDKRLKELRKKLGLSQAEFGDKIGVKPSAVGNWESGRQFVPNVRIFQICQIFNVSREWLESGAGDMFTNVPKFPWNYSGVLNDLPDVQKALFAPSVVKQIEEFSKGNSNADKNVGKISARAFQSASGINGAVDSSSASKNPDSSSASNLRDVQTPSTVKNVGAVASSSYGAGYHFALSQGLGEKFAVCFDALCKGKISEKKFVDAFEAVDATNDARLDAILQAVATTGEELKELTNRVDALTKLIAPLRNDKQT